MKQKINFPQKKRVSVTSNKINLLSILSGNYNLNVIVKNKNVNFLATPKQRNNSKLKENFYYPKPQETQLGISLIKNPKLERNGFYFDQNMEFLDL